MFLWVTNGNLNICKLGRRVPFKFTNGPSDVTACINKYAPIRKLSPKTTTVEQTYLAESVSATKQTRSTSRVF